MIGFNHALRGFLYGIKNERNFKIQFLIFVIVVLLAKLLGFSKQDWISLLILSAIVLGFELLNSAIEKVCDLYSKENNPQIKIIKDLSAGAVLLIAFFSFLCGIFLFYPYLLNLM